MDVGDIGVLDHDMIIGKDLMRSLGLIIDFRHKAHCWDDIIIPMNRIKLNF